jgi:phospholipase/lecithinase/hemolysin
MQSCRLLTVAAASLIAVSAHPAAVQAAPSYTAEYVFGDSLSDTGNLAALSGSDNNFTDPPSFHNSFTNGPVAVQVVASALGLNADPSMWLHYTGPNTPPSVSVSTSGTNYAFVAATAAASSLGGQSTYINLPQQIDAYVTHSGGTADPGALYTVFIGGNDVINATDSGGGLSAITTGVAAEVAAVQTLASAGARNLLVVNVPNVGTTPHFAQDEPSLVATATAYSQRYDSLLASGLAGLALPTGTSLTQFDLYTAEQAILANPSAYGLTDVTDPCYLDAPILTKTTQACGANAENIGTFAFWNPLHPTATVHAILGQDILAALGDVTPVPEPASLALLGAGLLGVVGARSRRGR